MIAIGPWGASGRPQVYLLAAKKLKVDPRKCLALEDSINGTLVLYVPLVM